MSAVKNIQAHTHELLSTLTPAFLHLLPDLPCNYVTYPISGNLSPFCRSLLHARHAVLRRSFLRWSCRIARIAARRVRMAFSCWTFQASKSRLPFASSLNIFGILQPSCRSNVLTAAAALLFSCGGRAPSIGSKWIRGIVFFIRYCIIRHICERIHGWYILHSARRLAGHWRAVAAQLVLFRTLGNWRRRQKLLRHFRDWRNLCSHEGKVRLHRCYHDTLSYDRSLRRCLALWHLHAFKISAAKLRLSSAATAFALRRAFFAWHQLGPILLFSRRCHSNSVMQMKRVCFDRLNHFKFLNIRSKRLAEQMRASVYVASNARLLRFSFQSFINAVASSKQNSKLLEQDEAVKCISNRHRLGKVFKLWSLLFKHNQLQVSQQVHARFILPCCYSF